MKFKFEKGYEVGMQNWDSTNSQLMTDLEELIATSVTEDEITEYLKQLYDSLERVENGRCDNMLFLMYDRPESMPADGRVRYVYKPTYIAATFMMTVYCRFERLRKDEKLNKILKEVLNATMAREFMGAGYDDISGFMDTLEIFAKGDTVEFIEKYCSVNEEFAAMFNKATTYLESQICAGKVIDPWANEDIYSERGKRILTLLQ